jgi:purine-binding chemotaxis protein CheW
MSTTINPAQAGAAQQGDARQFVTFQAGEETFALPMSAVREIIRLPQVVAVPLSPPELKGVANLRGQVLPIISLRTVFHFAEQAHDDSTRVVVVERGGLIGFVVDRVSSVLTVEAAQMEPASAIQAAVDTKLLAGVIKGVSGDRMALILDPEQLVSANFAAVLAKRARKEGGQDAAQRTDRKELAAERPLVSFDVAGGEYAFPIERVQEIVQFPERVTGVPNAARHVLGVMTLRNRLLPLVSLRRMFGLPDVELGPQHRIVVISLAQQGDAAGTVGIVMDAVNEVLRVVEALITPVPAILSGGRKAHEIEAICRLEDGQRLVSILSVERLFESSAVKEALAGISGAPAAAAPSPVMGASDTEEQLVVFRLAEEEYGVGIASVREIIRVPETMTKVPHTFEALEGVVNLRGQVLPVVDLRTRFGLPRVERDERQRIVVLALENGQTGFVVDAVQEVMKVPSQAVGPAPCMTEEQAKVMGRVANLEKQKRMILLVDPTHLLAGAEVKALADMR